MGQSTDAKLLYGFLVDDESDDAETCAVYMDDKYRELTKLEEATGCTIEWHCSDACTMYIACIKSSLTTAWRGKPKRIAHIHVAHSWDNQLVDFAKSVGLTYTEPAWWLASYWG
jgi:hypothetical protein